MFEKLLNNFDAMLTGLAPAMLKDIAFVSANTGGDIAINLSEMNPEYMKDPTCMAHMLMCKLDESHNFKMLIMGMALLYDELESRSMSVPRVDSLVQINELN